MGGGKQGKGVRWGKCILLGVLLCITAFILFLAVQVFKLDAWHEFDENKILGADMTLMVYDRTGAEAARLHATEDRVPVGLEDVPYLTRMAFVSAEDARFYEHIGVDFIRILGAAWADIKAGSYVQGASTISQQLIKLSHLTSEKTISRKLEEAVLAYQMEKQFSKDEILEMYLNYVYFGGGYYGIEAAALGYFGVHAEALTLPQSAMLAGILKSPSKYAPHLDPEASIGRRNLVLRLMRDYGYISDTEFAAATADVPILKHKGSSGEKQGYYIDAALSDALAVLNLDYETLLSGGYRIYTYMDANIQADCEAAFGDDSLFPAAAAQGAMVVQKAHSGEVVALVGGRNAEAARGFNRARDIRRQPGSVIKPVISYAPALENCGYTAATMILDEPTVFADYSPGNVNDKYYGWVTLREAVTRSLNVPAVKVLSDIGLARGMEFAASCGIEFSPKDNSLTLALGGFTYGVSPWQIAGAYNSFASGGEYYQPTVIHSITDSEGNVLYEHTPQPVRVMSEQNTYILTSMLESVVSDGTGRRLGELEIPLAGKTGTVGEDSGNRDAWMAVYNPEYTAAVWMGYDDYSGGELLPDDATGGKYPALVLSRVFGSIYKSVAAPVFSRPEGVVEYRLDVRSLQNQHKAALASVLTPKSSTLTEVFTVGTEPSNESEYWVVPSRPRDFSVYLDMTGRPCITFAAVESFIDYKLYRNDGTGATCIHQFGGESRVVYTDETAVPGHTYSYHVVPVHPELFINTRQVSGPSTISVTVTLPPAYEIEDIDLTGDAA